MITLALIAFCLGIFTLGYYCMAYVVVELCTGGPTAVTMCTASVAYATEGRAHPTVIAALQPVQRFAQARLEFMCSPGMAAMFALIFAAAGYEFSHGHELFSLAMPSLAVGMVVGFTALLGAVSWMIKSIDAARLMPPMVWLLPPETRPVLLHFSLPVPLKPPRFALVVA